MTTEAEAQSPGTRGEAMVAELKWVHSMIRHDLRIVREMADAVQEGRPGAEVASDLRTLATAGPLWQLKINCLQYCRVVHSHHHLESIMLFPALRRTNPSIGPVVDKLEADHARVSDLLDDVEAAARELADHEDAEVRQRLSAALRTLSDELLAHLAFEEDNVADTMRMMTGWPAW